MKKLMIVAATLTLISAPALAGGRGGSNGLNVNANVSTGKGGLIGTLLGSNGRGGSVLNVNANVQTGKGGVLGLLTGGSSRGGYGW